MTTYCFSLTLVRLQPVQSYAQTFRTLRRPLAAAAARGRTRAPRARRRTVARRSPTPGADESRRDDLRSAYVAGPEACDGLRDASRGSGRARRARRAGAALQAPASGGGAAHRPEVRARPALPPRRDLRRSRAHRRAAAEREGAAGR